LARSDEQELTLRWSGRIPLTARILAVNILALAMLAGGFFYLDSYRARLLDQRVRQVAEQTQLIAAAVAATPPEARPDLVRRMGALTGLRIRAFPIGPIRPGADVISVEPSFDSWQGGTPTYRLRDPEGQPWQRQVARSLDRAVDFVAGAEETPSFVEPGIDLFTAWPEGLEAADGGRLATRVREARDLTPVISASILAERVDPSSSLARSVLLTTTNARDVTRIVRDERLRLGIVLLAATLLSVLLSMFLARTIALPLRRLARAAHQVRLGRAREVDVPRLPARRDEIGLLARALHDMTQSLRYRIDATEAFAADVTHELKNPLASLRSAVDSLERIDDPELRRQLLDVVRHDVVRLDRLIVDIAEVSRLDAELTRARFEPVDLGNLVESLLPLWEERARAHRVQIAFARPRVGSAVVMGEESRLARAIDNVVDNAISFSPPDESGRDLRLRVDGEVVLTSRTKGPGVPAKRGRRSLTAFHSMRPEGEAFGRHSGLGLAIAKGNRRGS
jgi:two-component system sensor histidine kinase ChvG